MSARSEATAAPIAASSREDHRSPGPDVWKLRCPECGGSAFSAGSDVLCAAEGRRFAGVSGVLQLLRSQSARELSPFLQAYRTVRRREGWGGAAEYYRGLPFSDSAGRHRAIWKLRARSYRAALRAVEEHFPNVKRADELDKTTLLVLELGAGNGWLSWRMAEAGHYVLATDISLDEEDGLGALPRYAGRSPAFRARVTRARAEMEHLPLDDSQFDLVVAAGAFHYAESLSLAVSEAHRVLRPFGLFLVLDSPVYDNVGSGRAMVESRERDHIERYGIRYSSPSAGFLVKQDFQEMLRYFGFRVETRTPFEGVARRLRRIYCHLAGFAPPARFPLFVAEKRES